MAVYEHEPYALMMTVERLFASIMASAFSIRSVELWDGVVPEILKAYHQAHDAAKAPKEVTHVRMKPRPAQKSEGNLQEEDEEEGERENKKQEDHDLVIEEINGSSTRTGSRFNTGTAPTDIEDHLTDKKSGVIQTVIAPCSRPETADDITQAESSRPPTSQLGDENEDDLMDVDEIDGDDLVVRDVSDVDEDFAGDELDDIKSSNPRYPRRPTARSRTLSKASDMTMMSGAVQTPDEPATPKEDEEDHQEAKQAGKTAERYGGSCVSPATESYFTPRESTSALAQERLRVGPIIYATMDQPTPSDSRSPVINNNKGVVHGGSGNGPSQVMNNTDSSSSTTITTNPKGNRRGSLQTVLGRTFRRGSASSASTGAPAAPTTAPIEDSITTTSSVSSSKNNGSFGIPSTGLTGRPTLFHRRRSTAAGSALTVSATVASVGVQRVNSSNTSSPDASADITTMLQRPVRSVSTQEVPRVGRDSAGSRGVIRPPPSAAAAVLVAQPSLSQRPKMAKRLSSGRPFSYGKFEANMKEKNFGIPPHGL